MVATMWSLWQAQWASQGDLTITIGGLEGDCGAQPAVMEKKSRWGRTGFNVVIPSPEYKKTPRIESMVFCWELPHHWDYKWACLILGGWH